MRALFTAVIVLVLFVAALAVLCETMLPAAAGRAVEYGFTALVGEGAETHVTLTTVPAAKLLTGRVDRAAVEVKNLRAGGLTIDDTTATLEDVRVDVVALVTRREVALNGARNLDVTFRLSEANLSKYLASRLRGISDLKITIAQGKAVAGGDAAIAGRTFSITLEGVFVVRGRSRVGLEATGASVAGVSIPKALIDQLVASSGWTADLVDFAALPVPMEVREVRVEPGFVIVHATAAEVKSY